jgi:putative hemolysin
VSPYQTIDELLPVLQQRDDHKAVVVDAFGSAVGIITMEDILEEVVGEIDVGYDFEEYLPRRKRNYERLDEEVYLMDSRLSLSEANEVLGAHLATAEAYTLGGLILSRLRHIPKKGEYVVENGFRFTVEVVTERAIEKLRVEREA